MRAFLDANVVLDAIVTRDNRQFNDNASLILTLGENKVVDLFMSAITIPTVAYVLKNMTVDRKKEILRDLVSIVKVAPSLPEHVDTMLDNPAKDIEDSLQALSAKEVSCDVIITRNQTDFTEEDLPVLSPDEFLKRVII